MSKLSRPLQLLLKALAALSVIALTLLLALYAWVSTPTLEHNSLPPELLSGESPEGRALEAQSLREDLTLLRPWLQSQEQRGWCGAASGATALSALRGQRLSQAQLLDAGSAVRSPLLVSFTGMNLDQLAEILRANGAQAQAVHADEGDLQQFRAALIQNLSDPGDILLVNYARKSLNQEGGGHISPVGALHLEADRALVLDVATLRYPAVWVSVERLYAAMQSPDGSTGRPRGWVELRVGTR